MDLPNCWIQSCVVVVLSVASTALGAEKQALKSHRQPGETSRVEVTLDVGGDLKLVNDGKVQSLKMSAVGKLAYGERLLAAPAPDTENAAKDGKGEPSKSDGKEDSEGTFATADLRSLRHYSVAEAEIVVEKGKQSPRLRDECRLVEVDVNTKAALYCPQAALTRDELDLIDIPANSLLIERLLPADPVAAGDHWTHSDALLGMLLGLNAVSQSEVSSELKAIDKESAQIEIHGKLHGAVEGVSTEMELKGKYTFNRQLGRITRFGLLIKENRSVGHVGPGLDVVAKLQMSVMPGSSDKELDGAATDGLNVDPLPSQLALAYVSAENRFRFHHDRRWHIMSDKPEVLAVRMVDRGDLIAQCNISALADATVGTATTLKKFQEDIQKSLDKSFGQFVEAKQSTNSRDYMVYRVVVAGEASELPIEWHYYLVSEPGGRRVVFAFAVEQSLVEQLGQLDAEMVDTLEFMARPAKTAGAPTPAVKKPIAETAAQPATAGKPVAAKKSTAANEKSARQPGAILKKPALKR